jgi:hypothetical protein
MKLNWLRLLLLVCCTLYPCSAFGVNSPLPAKILTAKTIAVIAHYGFVPSAFNTAKSEKFKKDAEEILLSSGRFTVLNDPGKSDLVLLLVCGYSPGWLGFRDHIVIGSIFSGGEQPPWSPIPLWISEQAPTFRTHSAPAALARNFLKAIANAESKGGVSSPGPETEKASGGNAPTAEEKEDSPDVTQGSQWLRPEILQARRVMVLLRTDEVAGPKGEEKEKSVEQEIKKWGRFSIVDNPGDADLIFVCVKYLDTSSKNMPVYENLLIFKGGIGSPDWPNMPLWNAMQIEAMFAPAPGKQMTRWLRKQIEDREKQSVSGSNIPPSH